MNTEGCFKKTIQRGQDLTKKHGKLRKWQKQPMTPWKTNNPTILKKFVNASSNFLLEEIRRIVITNQTLTENDPQDIVTHGTWQCTIQSQISSLTILWPSHKGQNPTPKPSLLLQQVSNIHLFPD